jgi:hypothetical protein
MQTSALETSNGAAAKMTFEKDDETRPEPSEFESTPSERQYQIISASIYDNGIVVSFDDGKTALYSAKLLRATMPQARQMFSEE